MSTRKTTFSKVLYIVAQYIKCSRAVRFENVCQEKDSMIALYETGITLHSLLTNFR
jgi:hypothetical protein